MPRRNILPFILIVAVCAGALGIFLLFKYMPTSKKVSFRAAMELQDRDYFVLGDTPLTDVGPPVFKSGVLYVPVDFIKAYIDPYIFWDEKANRLSITTENQVIRMSTDNLNYFVNDAPMRLNLPAYQIDGNACLPAEFIEEFYHIAITYNADTGFAVVDLLDEPQSFAALTKKTHMRFEPNIKSPIVKTLAKAEEVIFLVPSDLNASETPTKFQKVRAEDGTLGYVPSDNLDEPVELPGSPRPTETPVRPQKIPEGKITMLWDQILKVEDNMKPEKFEPYPGLDVISPTWFSFDEEKLNGDIINIADRAYVEWAHENGYLVWALVTDNFNTEINHAILTDTSARENAIKQLLALVAMYGLDGINIDFEALRKADAEYYLQFLRELGPLLREQGASLSVDLFVPTFTQYYNRTEVGKVADYVCVMTYDEHYSGSETSGPVASLPFVDRGIADTMKEVPKEKILMGMPFYVRVWREVVKDGKVTHTIKNYGMNTAYDIFIENGARFTWLPDIGSYYGEYTATEDGEDITYRVWLEDLRSIEEKLALAARLDVAGVTCWKRGLEGDEVWDRIKEWKGE